DQTVDAGGAGDPTDVQSGDPGDVTATTDANIGGSASVETTTGTGTVTGGMDRGNDPTLPTTTPQPDPNFYPPVIQAGPKPPSNPANGGPAVIVTPLDR